MTSAQTHDRRVRFRDLSRLAPGGYDKLHEAFPPLRGPLFGPFTRRPRVRTFHGEGHAVMLPIPPSTFTACWIPFGSDNDSE